jgi:hypothetical protein
VGNSKFAAVFFSEAYQCACKFADGQSPCDITFREFENTAEVYEETAQ